MDIQSGVDETVWRRVVTRMYVYFLFIHHHFSNIWTLEHHTQVRRSLDVLRWCQSLCRSQYSKPLTTWCHCIHWHEKCRETGDNSSWEKYDTSSHQRISNCDDAFDSGEFQTCTAQNFPTRRNALDRIHLSNVERPCTKKGGRKILSQALQNRTYSNKSYCPKWISQFDKADDYGRYRALRDRLKLAQSKERHGTPVVIVDSFSSDNSAENGGVGIFVENSMRLLEEIDSIASACAQQKRSDILYLFLKHFHEVMMINYESFTHDDVLCFRKRGQTVLTKPSLKLDLEDLKMLLYFRERYVKLVTRICSSILSSKDLPTLLEGFKGERLIRAYVIFCWIFLFLIKQRYNTGTKTRAIASHLWMLYTSWILFEDSYSQEGFEHSPWCVQCTINKTVRLQKSRRTTVLFNVCDVPFALVVRAVMRSEHVLQITSRPLRKLSRDTWILLQRNRHTTSWLKLCCDPAYTISPFSRDSHFIRLWNVSCHRHHHHHQMLLWVRFDDGIVLLRQHSGSPICT